ncbi:MAG TPA: response regulator transcription factor [Fontimonas sp.]
MKLLIVEDNRRLLSNLFDYFEKRGHVLDAAPDGIVGKWLASTQRYDAIVLDCMLPRLNGYRMLQALREEAELDVPVIMLTARSELADKIEGFKAGADDYLTKPFEYEELEMRLHALVSRATRPRQKKILRVADLEFNLATQHIARGGQAVHLFPACKTLLKALMEASPDVVTHQQLEECLWGANPPESDRLRSYIHELRRQIDAPFPVKLVQTVPRVGYRIGAA